MNEENKSLLEDEIRNSLTELSNIGLTNEKKAVAIDNVAKLIRLEMEDSKNKDMSAFEAEKNDIETKKINIDEASKEKDSKDRKIDRIIKVALESLAIIAPLSFYGIWMTRGFRFEETGSYTSGTFKNLIQKFSPRR